ncbi:MAG: TIGR03617 family F420-dependent LLM class oxidoreductase [Cellvibrionales bacterium]|nr:TIGR03617 family F420-dependent LLM class oxidoreductase [Cellvibrionales bacterium]
MFKIDGPLYATLDGVKEEATALAQTGYDGLYTLEGAHDPFYPLVLAAEHAKDLELSTSIAVSFPRNPLHLAYQALDLQTFSKGKFILGLGSQIKPHIEKRFGVDFSPVAARMREQILAIKAIFNCFQHGERLDFEGEYYRHTLMAPMFNPGPCEYGLPPILTGGFGPKMCQMAGEAADGLIIHPFNNLPYIEDHALKNIHLGLEKANRSAKDFMLSLSAIVITGSNQEFYENAYKGVRSLLAFYGSTPAYLPAMEAIGFADLQPKLNRLSKENKMAEMEALIPDEFIRQFAVIGKPEEIAQKLMDKFGHLTNLSRLSIYAPYFAEQRLWAEIIKDIKKIQGR